MTTRVVIDRGRRTITCDGETVRLSAVLFEIVAYLAEHPGMVRSRDQIMHAACEGGGKDNDLRAVDSSIKRLRRRGIRSIRSYYGGGYYWDDGVPVLGAINQ